MEILQSRNQGKLLFSTALFTYVDANFAMVCILFHEFFGSAFFAYGVLVGLNGNFVVAPLQNTFSSVFVPLSFFLMICWGARFTKAHFNPAVTLAFMLKKKDRLPVRQGALYILAQLTGAFSGTAIAWSLQDMQNGAPWMVTFDQYKIVLEAFRGEVIGTLLFVLFVLVVSTPETTPCEAQLQAYIFVPAMFMCARQYSYRLQGLNPAFAISFQLFYCLFRGNWAVWQYVWSNFLGPLVGSCLSVLFFELVLKKFLVIYNRKPQLGSSRINFKQAEMF